MLGREKDRFELENSDFHHRVRNFYLKLAAENSKNWLVLDANKKPKELFLQLVDYIKGQSWSY